jgi:hypothetical protein
MQTAPQGEPERPRRVRLAAWSLAAGLAVGAAAVTGLVAGAISSRQAMGMALPAALLAIGGAITLAIPGPAASRWLGFRAGLRAGTLMNRWRSAFRRRERP